MSIALKELNIYDPYNAYISLFLDDHFKYNKLHDQLKLMPKNLLDFLFDLKTANFIKEKIAISLDLNQSQSQEISIIVLEFVTSNLYLGNIVEEVKNRLGVGDIKAKTIAGLILTELFAPILEELKQTHIRKFAKNIPQAKALKDRGINDRIVDLRNNP